ncbi:hypothetical protein [Streptoalloteichus hindustanus]|uniref:Uncharacterized protein n=1 Tax=Streptoalloteichus hindustanus TaxID=2017 RepID=A0A1M5CPD0_STRHI|nr:hypothetical protein [Streptoalloteichus hindustanus]SHF56571.1 hypothetical protein SAMN05444320_104110 [Streptoalloteichus hindustanus]
MTSQGERAGVADVVRDVVARVAPEEIPIVDGLDALGADTAARHWAKAGARREPLGFGLGDAVVVVTPIVWWAVEHVAGRLAESATDGVVSRARRLFRRRKAIPRVVDLPLTPEQLAEVRRKALEAGARQGLPPERSEEIADAIVARLALRDAEPE